MLYRTDKADDQIRDSVRVIPGIQPYQHNYYTDDKFDENVNEGDTEISNDGVSMVVDPMSIQYLMGAEVDFVEGLQGSQFVINNPNASTTCGCGSSFSI